MRANSRVGSYLRELRLPRDERAVARAERRAARAPRGPRDSEHTAERRAAALEAERRREYPSQSGIGGI
jgi:hypothetical protein